MLKIKDLFKYQDNYGVLEAPIKPDNKEELDQLQEQIIAVVGLDLFEAYNDANSTYVDKLREYAYIQGFKDGISLSGDFKA